MKIHKTIGCQVIIDVEKPWLMKDDEAVVAYSNAADSLIADIKRHVDGYSFITYKLEEQDECSFCGREWEVFSKEDEIGNPALHAGMPACCVKAEEEWLVEHKND